MSFLECPNCEVMLSVDVLPDKEDEKKIEFVSEDPVLIAVQYLKNEKYLSYSVLELLIERADCLGLSPLSTKDVALTLNISYSSAKRRVEKLESLGLISRMSMGQRKVLVLHKLLIKHSLMITMEKR